MLRSLVFVLAAACGAREVTPATDYGNGAPTNEPPPDPIACPLRRLELFAARLSLPLTISTEQIVDAARIDKVPCKPAETDEACITRARTRAVPLSYEVAGVTIGGDNTTVEYTYDLDGRRITETSESMEAMVARLKAFQASGHKVVLLRGESAADAGARHAAIAYRGVGGRQRRIATLRAKTDNPGRIMSDAQAQAEHDFMEIREMRVDEQGEVVVTATCGPGGS